MNISRSHPTPPDGKVSAIRQQEVVDYRSVAEPRLPVREVSSVQLHSGPAPTNLAVFSSDTVAVLGVEHHVASVGVVIMRPEYFSFMWWDGNGECRINGDPARRTVIHAQGEQDGFHATGGPRRTMGMGVRRDLLVESIAALGGVGPEDVRLRRSRLELSAAAASRFQTGVAAHVHRAIDSIRIGSSDPNIADPSDALFGLLVEAYLGSRTDPPRDRRVRRPEEIVRKAEERFFASQGDTISLGDLCAAARVSQSALYRAFDTVCGEPPLAYFHKRRLTDARRVLINSPAYRGAVKRAALTAGLTEFGRFSVEYRTLFGESPSATLSRGAGSSIDGPVARHS